MKYYRKYTYENLENIAKIHIREKFMALYTYIRKAES